MTGAISGRLEGGGWKTVKKKEKDLTRISFILSVRARRVVNRTMGFRRARWCPAGRDEALF